MANAIARQILINGSRDYVVKFTIIGDGSGEETATILNSTTGDLGTTPRISKLWSNLSGFSARLLWDASTDVFATQLVSDFPIDQDYTDFGGLVNNAGSGKTGDILITTSGLGTGDSGSIIVWVAKI